MERTDDIEPSVADREAAVTAPLALASLQGPCKEFTLVLPSPLQIGVGKAVIKTTVLAIADYEQRVKDGNYYERD